MKHTPTPLRIVLRIKKTYSPAQGVSHDQINKKLKWSIVMETTEQKRHRIIRNELYNIWEKSQRGKVNPSLRNAYKKRGIK